MEPKAPQTCGGEAPDARPGFFTLSMSKPQPSAVERQPNTPHAQADATTPRRGWFVLTAIFLAALNLRPAITSLSPLLETVRADLQLSVAMAGVLAMLPVTCFGVFTLLAPPLLRRMSADRVVLVGLIALAVGLTLRSLIGVTGMFAGTLLAGASISIVLVALPSIIKREYGARASLLMGFYSMSLCLGASVAAGLSAPLQAWLSNSWQLALAFWLLPAAGTALLWLRPVTHLPVAPAPRPASDANVPAPVTMHLPTPNILRNPLAWMVTLYMGLQSFLSYCAITWLPAMLIDRGMTQIQAGFGLSICFGVQLITSVVAPWLGGLGKDQRPSITLMLSLTLLGMLGVLYAPITWLWPCIVVTGLGMGGTFSLALALLVLRAPNPSAAAALAGMAQGVGYVLASLGPVSLGVLYATSRQWHTTALLMTVVVVLAWLCGMRAGRNQLIWQA